MRFALSLLLMLGMLPGALHAQQEMAAGTQMNGRVEDELLSASQEEAASGGFVAPRESAPAEKTVSKSDKVLYNPKTRRDPTLSPDDALILADRAEKLRIAQEKERKRRELEAKKEAERQERERQRQLLLLKYPELEVKNRIRIGGVIGKEVFFGNNVDKMYTVGSSISVRGESGNMRRVKIVAINLDSVVFSYNGRKFTKRI